MSLTNFRGCQVILASSYADDICSNLVPIIALNGEHAGIVNSLQRNLEQGTEGTP